MRERADCGADFKAMMSLDQSLMATLSMVGLSGELCYSGAKILYFGCGGGCDNDRVHKGVVFMGIVKRSSSSFFYSTRCFFLFFFFFFFFLIN